MGFGAWTLSRAPAIVDENGPLAVRIVQPSIAQAMKWDNAERRAIFDKLVGLTEEAPAEGEAAA